MSADLDWIGVDWGTSNVRCWGISADGDVVFTSRSDKGMRSLEPAEYPGVLDEVAGGYLAAKSGVIPVVVCGMAGAREGWREAPYASLPAALDELAHRAVAAPSGDRNLDVRILPGLCQDAPGREDVMRGEEVQLLGLTAIQPGYAGTVCLPGTHAKWVRVDEDRVLSFRTTMTGELYDVLSKHSVLRHSMPPELVGEDTEAGIADGLEDGISHPETLTASLFRTRAASLLSGKPPHWCAGYLSGLLVGAEVGGMRTELGGAAVPIIGAPRLCRLYASALHKIGIESKQIEGTEAVLAGLRKAREVIDDWAA